MSYEGVGLYLHFKGDLYYALGEALHTETNETLVVYRAWEGDRQLYVRPLSSFNETVYYSDIGIPRFKKVG